MCSNIRTLLYYGSIFKIDKVDVSFKTRGDFGRGIYLSDSKKQAEGLMHKKYREYAQRGLSITAMSKKLYEVELDSKVFPSSSIKEFVIADEEWVDFILKCRWEKYASHDYDLVIGPTADDDTYFFLCNYMDGAYGKAGSISAKLALLDMLETENLGVQYCISKQYVADKLIKYIKEIEWR